MQLSESGLRQLLQSNVVELAFRRRREIKNRSPFRKMLATLNLNILNSENGQTVFNFKTPISSPSYNTSYYKLITVFDIFMQDWRNIPVDQTNIIQIISCEPVEKFWEYFENVLSKMSAAQKAAFMEA